MNSYKFPGWQTLGAVSIAAVFGTSIAAAQEGGARVLEEIVVTAAYREQGLQDVPVSISAVTGGSWPRLRFKRPRTYSSWFPTSR